VFDSAGSFCRDATGRSGRSDADCARKPNKRAGRMSFLNRRMLKSPSETDHESVPRAILIRDGFSLRLTGVLRFELIFRREEFNHKLTKSCTGKANGSEKYG
jgi:hypothetical protein